MVIRERVVLVWAVVLLVAVSLPGCTGGQTIEPRVVDFSPYEEPEVAYMAIPPCELSARVFPSGAVEENAWSHARGKWILWSGEVIGIEPKLNPSRLVFYYPYEGDWASLRIWSDLSVIVEFGDDDKSTEALRQLSVGDHVYYRAKLVRHEPSLSPIGQRITLKDGQLVDSEDRAARLVALSYTSYDNLTTLMSLAEQTATVSNYFEQRLELDWWAVRGVEILSPIYIRVPQSPGQPSEAVLAPIRAVKIDAEARVETSVAAALKYLHTASPAEKDYLTRYVDNKRVIHSDLVAQNCSVAQKLWEAYESQRQLPGLQELAKAVLGLIPGIGDLIGAILGVQEAIGFYADLKEAEQLVASCYILLGAVTDAMGQIADDVTEAAGLAVD